MAITDDLLQAAAKHPQPGTKFQYGTAGVSANNLKYHRLMVLTFYASVPYEGVSDGHRTIQVNLTSYTY